jgi:hypothetical protein
MAPVANLPNILLAGGLVNEGFPSDIDGRKNGRIRGMRGHIKARRIRVRIGLVWTGNSGRYWVWSERINRL